MRIRYPILLLLENQPSLALAFSSCSEKAVMPVFMLLRSFEVALNKQLLPFVLQTAGINE